MIQATSCSSRLLLGFLVIALLTLLAATAPLEALNARQLADEVAETSDSQNSEKPVDTVTIGDHYVVLQVLPHDARAFTQGLTYFDGNLWEGTGLFTQSELRRVDPNTGDILQKHKLAGKYFGEGIAHFNDENGNARIIQITWKSGVGWIYDATSFDILREFHFATKTMEGWGITYNKEQKEFIVSDGSSHLFFWDRDTLQEKRRIEVFAELPSKSDPNTTKKQAMHELNELEWHNGAVLANVWYQDILLKIDPITGIVQHIYNFENLYKDRADSADCFNGISVTDKEDELWVTGKQWPVMFRIKLLL
jgi:glutaminyl-peptide cyclotransferase